MAKGVVVFVDLVLSFSGKPQAAEKNEQIQRIN